MNIRVMRVSRLFRFLSAVGFLCSFIASQLNCPAQNSGIPFAVSIWTPTNGQTFTGPTNLYVHARVTDSNVVQTLQYYSGATLIGTATNTAGVLLTNTSFGNTLYIIWSNVPPGSYSLTAVATDSAGTIATSAPVNITVKASPPVPFTIRFYYPTNGQVFIGPTNIPMYAIVTDSNLVDTVEFYSGASFIGVVTNKNSVAPTNASAGTAFGLTWSNVPPGSYSLTAVATDSSGAMLTSAPINITVKTPPPPPPVPFAVGFYYPTNGQSFTDPTNLYLHAWVTDSNVVRMMQYFAGSNSLAIITNTGTALFTNTSTGNPFAYSWTNPPPGSYILTAVATDSTGASVTSAPVNITVKAPPPVPFAIRFYYPTNGQVFTGPTNIPMYAIVTDSNLVKTVQFYSGANFIGAVTNKNTVPPTNASAGNAFGLTWSNVPPGSYTLSAVVTDSSGAMLTSAPINITIKSPPPSPPIPFAVGFYYPTNGQSFTNPTNLYLHAWVTDSNVVRTMQYFAGSNSLAIVTNSGTALFTNTSNGNPFTYFWTNPPPGSYILTAFATDTTGATATSAPVNITVKAPPPPPPVPFVVGFYYPTNGQVFTGPTSIGLHASVTDSNVVKTVQYFSGNASIGIVSNTSGVLLTNTSSANPFFLLWSNVPPGSYALTAVATDSGGATATSAIVNITVLSNRPTPNVPTMSIYAPDPVAIEGTNLLGATNNTATFLIRRDMTNASLTVYYAISGTATNGEDYATIPNSVTLAAGQRYGTITITPLPDNDETNRYESVILALTLPPGTTNSDSALYQIGTPAKAGAAILEENVVPIVRPMVHSFADRSVHVSLPATNGMNFCLQVSTNFTDWVSVCTNTVLKGSAQFVDPDGTCRNGAMYRIVPVAGPAAY